MANKQTPETLRQQAKKLMLKADMVQKDNDAKLGVAIREIAENGFSITYEELKTTVAKFLKQNNQKI